MTVFLRLFILSVSLMFFYFFYLYIEDDKYYPGASFQTSNMPLFELEDLYSDDTCRIEHGFLVKLSSQGIPIMGLNYKDERIDAINWITKFGDPYKFIIHDLKGELALDMGVTGAPETFLINNGKIIAHYRGEVNEMIWSDVFSPIIKKENLFND
ncbi:MAG: DsbE family thiol:disulfide interchange protein [Proteobacteria bacterium]|nr:DsbE family thiol:disulfide interchange protein [Pseudomonadota bacterium]